jgi:glycosyl transferase family 87
MKIAAGDEGAAGIAPRRPAVTARGLVGALTTPAILVILWAGVLLHGWTIFSAMRTRVRNFDFSIYYASALALHENLDPYTTDLESVGGGLGLEIDPIHYATDPPTFLLMIEPLARMPLRRAFWVWNGLNLAALIAAVILLLYGSSLDTRLKWALAALALLYAPVGEHFFYAQNKILVLFLLAAMMRCMERRHDAAAGLILGFAGAIRGFPLLLAGYLFMQRRTRALLWTGAGLALCGLVTVALLGVHQTLSFSHGLFFVTRDRFLVIPINISLGAFISRLFWYSYTPTPGSAMELIRRVVVALAELGLLTLTVRATLRVEPGGDTGSRAFSLWVMTSVLLSPTAWVHYLVMALIPFALIADAVNRGRASHRALWIAVASYVVVALSTSGRALFGPQATSAIAIAVAECSFLSLLMVYVAAYWFVTDRDDAVSIPAAQQPGIASASP